MSNVNTALENILLNKNHAHIQLYQIKSHKKEHSQITINTYFVLCLVALFFKYPIHVQCVDFCVCLISNFANIYGSK